MPLPVQLNPEQRTAVEHAAGPLLVLAGAGSGKTRVLTARIAHLVEARGLSPFALMAVTFTNKAAAELKFRLSGSIPERTLSRMWVGTFHGLCARMLRLDGEAVGIPRDYVIYDESEQLQLMKGVLKALDLDEKAYSPRAVLSQVSRAKNHAIDPASFEAGAVRHHERNVARAFRAYQAALARSHALDFDDLLLEAVRLLGDAPQVGDRYRQRFEHVLVDEYQDTNQAQYRLLRELLGPERNLFAVGDPDQSIYSFRAADFRIIMQFREDFPDAHVVALEENYRSTGHILAAANGVIAHNQDRYPKDLWTRKDAGEPLAIFPARDEHEEAEYVVEQLVALRSAGGPNGKARPLSELAVLYRTNAQSRAIEEALIRAGLPYRLVGGTRFIDRKEVKDALAYLRLLANPYDRAAFERALGVPRRGVGPASVQKMARLVAEREISWLAACADPGLAGKAGKAVAEFAALFEGLALEPLPLPELVQEVLEVSGLLREYGSDPSDEQRLENLAELVSMAVDFVADAPSGGGRVGSPGETPDAPPTLVEFLAHAALMTSQDAPGGDDPTDRLTLMTLHAAKGLEFPVVFLCGLEEGLFPHQRTFDSPAELEEERRLCYVGMTRAMERLHLCFAMQRNLFGEPRAGLPSRFLSELPEGVAQWVREVPERGHGRSPRTERAAADPWTVEHDPAENRLVRREPAGAPAPRFEVGDAVRHATFGNGVVARIIGSGDRACLAVAFDGIPGQKLLDPRFAPLERSGGLAL